MYLTAVDTIHVRHIHHIKLLDWILYMDGQRLHYVRVYAERQFIDYIKSSRYAICVSSSTAMFERYTYSHAAR